jgi:hypothetical protein
MGGNMAKVIEGFRIVNGKLVRPGEKPPAKPKAKKQHKKTKRTRAKK